MSDKPQRHLRWGLPEAPIPKHPYRDTMLVYGFFAALVVLLAWVTGGDVKKGILVAIVVWAAASVWGMARYRQRIQREEARRRALEDEA